MLDFVTHEIIYFVRCYLRRIIEILKLPDLSGADPWFNKSFFFYFNRWGEILLPLSVLAI